MRFIRDFRAGLIHAIEPSLYLLVLAAIYLINAYHPLPTSTQIFAFATELLQRHGVWVVFAAAFGEGIVLANLYFPGSVVIVLSVTAVRGSPLHAALLVGTTALGFLAAALLNYGIGAGPLHRLAVTLGGDRWMQKAKSFHERWGDRALLLAYVHPNFGAFCAVNAGKMRSPFSRFVVTTSLAIALWTSLWGLVAYTFADAAKSVVSNSYLVFGIIACWFLISFSRGYGKSAKYGQVG